MYDRLRSLGRYATRPIAPGGATATRTPHVRGAPLKRPPKR